MTMTTEGSAKTLSQLVALEVRLELVRQDMNQAELARKIGKNEQWLSVRLRGKQPIDVNDLALIARGLRKRVHDLLPDEPDTARAAAEEPMVRYDAAPERTTQPARRRPHNRSDGQRPDDRAHNITRTARVPRPAATTRP